MTIDIFSEATAVGAWLSALKSDWAIASPIADDLLRADHGCHQGDARQELVGQWLRIDPSAATRAAVCVRVGHLEDAKIVLRKSLAIFFATHPTWYATRVTPTRAQIAAMWGGAPAYAVDDLSDADRRQVARDLLQKGAALAPRGPDDTGAPISLHRRAVVRQIERGGIPVSVVEAEPLSDADSGAMPSPRPIQRRVLGDASAPPHPRSTQE